MVYVLFLHAEGVNNKYTTHKIRDKDSIYIVKYMPNPGIDTYL